MISAVREIWNLYLCLYFQVSHPIDDQSMFLNENQKRQLKEEFGKILIWTKNSCIYLLCYGERLMYDKFSYEDIEPWTFEQHLGEAVFIPAGCPHQVRNIQVSNSLLDTSCFIVE